MNQLRPKINEVIINFSSKTAQPGILAIIMPYMLAIASSHSREYEELQPPQYSASGKLTREKCFANNTSCIPGKIYLE